MVERVDLLVIGAGPAGCAAAAVAAGAGLKVLLVEQRPCVGLPVQCAEYVPAQIVGTVTVAERCIAQRIRTLLTHLPDGEVVESPAPGYVLDRALFDKGLAVAARRAGAEVWTSARAVERTPRGALVRRGAREVAVACTVMVGADGPRSTVGRWLGQVNEELLDAWQVEVVLPAPQPSTQVFFDAAYPGGYGWLFPKGETANVGVGVNRRLGGDPGHALAHLLDRLQIGAGAVVGRTAGLVPCGGPLPNPRVDNVLLVGDAAGHTHPITGAGIFAAVVGGTLAGQAAAHAVQRGDLTALDEYTQEWSALMGSPLRHALEKRRELDRHWGDDPVALSAAIRRAWIAFREYGRRTTDDRPRTTQHVTRKT